MPTTPTKPVEIPLKDENARFAFDESMKQANSLAKLIKNDFLLRKNLVDYIPFEFEPIQHSDGNTAMINSIISRNDNVYRNTEATVAFITFSIILMVFIICVSILTFISSRRK